MAYVTALMLLCFCQFIGPFNILVLSPAVSRSHFKVGEAIAIGLADVGHNVTLVSPYDYRPKNQNIEAVEITGLSENVRNRAKDRAKVWPSLRISYNRRLVDHISGTINEDLTNIPCYRLAPKEWGFGAASAYLKGSMKKTSTLDAYQQIPIAILLPIILYMGTDLCNLTLSHPNLKALYDRKFDLIILEIFSTESLIGLGQQFNAPVIAYSALTSTRWTNDLIGNQSPLSYIAHPFMDLPDKMNLWHRICNTLFYVYESILLAAFHHPSQRSVYNAAFPDAKLSYDEARKNVSLIFVNSHFSLARPIPYVPNTIEIGGLHIDRIGDPLPQEVNDFIESADHGVLLFSMGSVMNSTAFPIEKRDIFINAFAKMKQKIIWKFEDKTVDMPKNVLTMGWLPQSNILAHPNVKAFISHGGLLGTAEAVYHGVPMIAMPLSGDTRLNVERASQDGWVIRFDYRNITTESVEWVLNEIVDNDKYLKNAKIMSQRYRDQPMTPNSLMVYWSEYVIRHKGAPHLRSSGLDFNYFQYHNIDAFFVILASIVVVIYAIKWTICKTCCRCRKSKREHQSDEKKRQ